MSLPQPSSSASLADLPAKTGYKHSGFFRAMKALRNALEGFGAALKHESSFRQEVALAALMVPVAILLPVGLLGKALMIAAVFLVLMTELLNSAIEWAIDYISLNRHPYAKRAKDMGSAAVLVSLVNCGLIWALVIAHNWEPVSALFGRLF